MSEPMYNKEDVVRWQMERTMRLANEYESLETEYRITQKRLEKLKKLRSKQEDQVETEQPDTHASE